MTTSERGSAALFHVGTRPEDRGSAVTLRAISQAHPGGLYERAMEGVASRLGEHVGRRLPTLEPHPP